MVLQADCGPTRSRPTGTVTFLFSDIEGSMQRWERNRAAMSAAVRRHDALMRDAIEATHGYVFKTVGDAFCAAFATASEALAAALAAQRALNNEDFSTVEGVRVRMALHSGNAEERDGDYFGPAVNRVARLLAVGHGGQVLVSGATVELLRNALPPRCGLRDLGSHRLKDLAHAEHVWQVVTPDLPEAFPALDSLDDRRHNLPSQLTSFVGRDRDVAAIGSLLQSRRLVTLTGTGGAGKTRCALQAGAERVGDWQDGVWFVDLAPLSDGSLVASTAAQALGICHMPNNAPLDVLVAHLRRKSLLLIIDNCEHVIEHVRVVAAAILRECPEVRILATSREPLTIAGEQTVRMTSLSVPPSDGEPSAERILGFGGALLFVDRARASDARFTLTRENAPFVADICRRLDGIPLAIELAAARISVLSPMQLAQKLDERFRVLTGGDRSGLPRHRTMRALIDWSYELLSEPERAVFRRLSIFAGSFALEATSAVCCDETADEIDVLNLISSLVDKSLVQSESGGGNTRYRILESNRQYAREKLRECGEFDAVARKHARTYVELAEQLESAWRETPDRCNSAQPMLELENWRVALEWTLANRGDVLLGQRLAGALAGPWLDFAAEARMWVAKGLEAVDATTPQHVVAKLWLVQARLYGLVSEYKPSLAAAERALELCRSCGDAFDTAQAQLAVGRALVFLGRCADGEPLLQEALVTARASGARRLTSHVLLTLAHARHFAGDMPAARARYDEALMAAKAIGADALAASIAGNLAEAQFRDGDAAEALRLAAESLATVRAQKATLRMTIDSCNMAAYAIALERYDEAYAYAAEALALGRDGKSYAYVAFALQHLAAVAVLQRSADADPTRHERAARVLGYVDQRLRSLDVLREYTEDQEYVRILAALRATLGDDVGSVMAAGRNLSEDQACAEAIAVSNGTRRSVQEAGSDVHAEGDDSRRVRE